MASSARKARFRTGIVDARETPAYSLSEAARYLQSPSRTVHNWVYGSTYDTRAGARKSLPLRSVN